MTVLQQASVTASGSITSGSTNSTKKERRLQQKASNSTTANTTSTGNKTTTGNSTANSTNGTNSTAAAAVVVVKPLTTTDPAKLYSDPKIVLSGLNKLVNAESFVITIAEVGLNPYSYGVRTFITKQVADIAKAKLKYEGMQGGAPFSSVKVLGELGYKPDGSPMVQTDTGVGNGTNASRTPSAPEFPSAPNAPTCSLNFFNDTKKPTSIVVFTQKRIEALLVGLKSWMFQSSGGKVGSPPPANFAKPVVGPNGQVLPPKSVNASAAAIAGAKTTKGAFITGVLTAFVMLFVF